MTQRDNTISQQIEDILLDIASTNEVEDKQIRALDDTHVQIKDRLYQVVVNYREGFQLEALEQRYQEYFDKFDYIVGDWGFEQLRLRGFYQSNARKVPKDQTIDFLDDYLKEYCNFGCQYFVLAKERTQSKHKPKKSASGKNETQPIGSPLERHVTTRETSFEQKPKKMAEMDKTKAPKAFKQKKRQQEVLNAEKPTSVSQPNRKGNFVIKQKMK